jgi:hypothetical protein
MYRIDRERPAKKRPAHRRISTLARHAPVDRTDEEGGEDKALRAETNPNGWPKRALNTVGRCVTVIRMSMTPRSQ